MTKYQPENAARKQRGKPFEPGQSGNPAGKPKGARHKTTVLAEQLMRADAEDIVRSVIERAKGGDLAAAKIVLDRIVPVRKGACVQLELPQVNTALDIGIALTVLLQAMAAGEITPDEAATIGSILEVRRKAIETIEIEERLTALEAKATRFRGQHRA